MSTDVNVANLLGMAKTAVLGGNNEEALSYFNRVLEIDPHQSEAWMGKGRAAAWQSTLVNIRLPEALIAFNHAIANAPGGNQAAVTQEAVDAVNGIATALYGMARKHLVEYASLDATWPAYIAQVSQLLDALETARTWAPQNRVTLENVVHLCKDNIEGYSFRNRFNNNAPALHRITPKYEQFLRTRMDEAIQGLRLIDASYMAPTVEKKTADACFVVTATMGDFDHPDVTLLRRFRDEWLMARSWGRGFVAAYYRLGPHLARLIKGSDRVRRASYYLIVRPAARFARERTETR